MLTATAHRSRAGTKWFQVKPSSFHHLHGSHSCRHSGECGQINSIWAHCCACTGLRTNTLTRIVPLPVLNFYVKKKSTHVFTVTRGNDAQTHRERESLAKQLICLQSSHPPSSTTHTFIHSDPTIHSTHTPAQNMSQAGRPHGFHDPWRVAGVSKEGFFSAKCRVFSSAGPLSISLAGLQRSSCSKSTAQLVMAQQPWQGRNVAGPRCQTTANGCLKTWTRARRGFLQHTRHCSGGGEMWGGVEGIWRHYLFQPCQSIFQCGYLHVRDEFVGCCFLLESSRVCMKVSA